MSLEKPTEGLKKALAFLGEPCEIRVIDQENVIYRDLGEGHDIEISGLDHSRKAMNAKVYVWQRVPHLEITEIYENVKGLLDLKDLLGAIALKYRNADHEKPLYVKSR